MCRSKKGIWTKKKKRSPPVGLGKIGEEQQTDKASDRRSMYTSQSWKNADEQLVEGKPLYGPENWGHGAKNIDK